MDESVTIRLNKQEQKKLAMLAKNRRKAVPILIREWIDKEIQQADLTQSAIPEKEGLGDLLSSVPLKSSFIGLDSKSALQKSREE